MSEETLLRRSKAPLLFLVAAIILLIAVLVWKVFHPASLEAQPVPAVDAAAVLTAPIPANLPNANQVRRGQYLVRVGDCMSCHLAAGGKPFAGGLGLNTPFGVIYSANITSDPRTGIGNFTPDQFYHAMHDGIGARGERLYPAFPYPWFTRVSRSDSDAILAYLKTTPAVSYTPPSNKLPFPMNIRLSVAAWDQLYLNTSPFQRRSDQSAEWNLGAQIVNGLGHCTACHTPKNLLGANRTSEQFRGGEIEDSFAPDLTGNRRTGLGSWSVDDIVQYLQTGRNAHASASSQMADVITYSTSLMSPDDVRAIAVYLKGLPPSPDPQFSAPDTASMRRGEAIFSDACTACHLEGARGQAGLFPPLRGSAVAQQNDPMGVIHIILAGTRVGPSPKTPTPFSMPSFGWKLNDQEVADVATYIRNGWGNRAAPVSAGEVQSLRKKLRLEHPKLTVNSGDHDPSERSAQ